MSDWLEIPESTVWLENGRTAIVPPFRVGKQPVSLGEFRSFCEATGYVTSAERFRSKETYKSNKLLNRLRNASREERRHLGIDSPADIDRFGVSCVSQEDAVAYCQWCGHRLPTDAEWLAAAMIEWEPRDLTISEHAQYARLPRAIRREGAEWTAETGSLEQLLGEPHVRRRMFEQNDVFEAAGYRGDFKQWALVRRGPTFVPRLNWRNAGLANVAPAAFSFMILYFRVCISAGEGPT